MAKKTNNKHPFWTRGNQVLNLDLSHRCPLECPYCLRQKNFLNKNIPVPGQDLSYENFIKITKFVNRILFCGQLSDPIHHPNFIQFLKICYEKNIDTHIATASSYKSKNWFIDAFKSNPDAIWYFGIDGLPKDSHKHRKNQDGEKLFDIMLESTKYLQKKPTWQYIICKYNENDIDKAINICKENNILFTLINSKRWSKLDELRPTKRKYLE